MLVMITFESIYNPQEFPKSQRGDWCQAQPEVKFNASSLCDT